MDPGVPFKAGSLLGASSSGVNSGKLFVDVLHSSSGAVARTSDWKVFSSCLLDLCPVSSCFETGSVGEKQSAVDCFVLEYLPWSCEETRPVLLCAVAVSVCLKKEKGILGIIGLLRKLGQI